MKESQGNVVMQKAEVSRRALTLQLAGSKLPKKFQKGAKRMMDGVQKETLMRGCFNGVVGMESI